MAHTMASEGKPVASNAGLERRELGGPELDLVCGGTIHAPRDAQTGQATGKRTWAPIRS